MNFRKISVNLHYRYDDLSWKEKVHLCEPRNKYMQCLHEISEVILINDSNNTLFVKLYLSYLMWKCNRTHTSIFFCIVYEWFGYLKFLRYIDICQKCIVISAWHFNMKFSAFIKIKVYRKECISLYITKQS